MLRLLLGLVTLGVGHQATVVRVHGTGPTDITFVNPADDPRKK